MRLQYDFLTRFGTPIGSHELFSWCCFLGDSLRAGLDRNAVVSDAVYSYLRCNDDEV